VSLRLSFSLQYHIFHHKGAGKSRVAFFWFVPWQQLANKDADDFTESVPWELPQTVMVMMVMVYVCVCVCVCGCVCVCVRERESVCVYNPMRELKRFYVDNDPTGRRAGWRLEVDPRGWDVVHGDGRRRMGVDAFSRWMERDRHGRE